MNRFDEEHLRSLFVTERAPAGMDRLARERDALDRPAAGRDPRPAGWRAWLAPGVGATLTIAAVLGVASVRQPLHRPRPPITDVAGVAGVPPDTALVTHPGDLVVDRRGALIENRLVTGRIIVTAPDVVIRRTRVRPSAGTEAALTQATGATNLTVEEFEIAGPGAGAVRYGISQGAPGLTVRRCDIRGTVVGARVTGTVTVTGNHIHDLADPSDATGIEVTGIEMTGGDHITVTGNTVLAPVTGAAAVVVGGTAPLSTVDIRGNILGGGRYVLRFGVGASTAVTVVDNRFSRVVAPNGGRDGPSQAWDATGPGNVWIGNIWSDTGDLVPPER